MPVFRRTKRWLIPLSGLLLSSIFLASCDGAPASILDTHGRIASSESFLFWIILGLATLVFVLVEGALLYSMWRFRDRPGRSNPRQIHGNMTFEILWTAIPTGLLIILLFFTIRGLIEVAPESEPVSGNTVHVTAIGHQWWWEFYYPQYGITTADSLHVPTGTDIHVDLFSNNVIHSFWVPALTGKTDVIPGHNNMKWFVANDPGTYVGICAEYCGTQHANMRFNVVAESNDSFQSWAHTQQMAAQTPEVGSLAAQGADVFKNGGCSSCHGIVGVNAQEFANTAQNCNGTAAADKASDCLLGPNLTHFGSRNLIAGGVLENNACDPNDPNLLQNCHLAQWLHDPQGVKPGNDMQIGPLSNSQIKALVAYLESLK